jgi:hypothetical protein
MRNPRTWILLTVVALLGSGCDGSDATPGYSAYEEYRQVESQEIPGTWGSRLEPLPEDYDPKLSPEEVLDRYAADSPRGAIILDLARYRDTLTYVIDHTPSPPADTPAWVFLTRGLCFNSEKGALVASARRPDSYGAQRCSLANISVLAVDADTGALISTARGFDESLEWSPARAGNPSNPGAGTATPVVSGTPVVGGAPQPTP